MATQSTRRRGSVNPPARKFKMVSVKLDVLTDSRVCVAAGIAGIDKSAYLSRVITKAVAGIIIIDRRKSSDQVVIPDGADGDIDEDVAA